MDQAAVAAVCLRIRQEILQRALRRPGSTASGIALDGISRVTRCDRVERVVQWSASRAPESCCRNHL